MIKTCQNQLLGTGKRARRVTITVNPSHSPHDYFENVPRLTCLFYSRSRPLLSSSARFSHPTSACSRASLTSARPRFTARLYARATSSRCEHVTTLPFRPSADGFFLFSAACLPFVCHPYGSSDVGSHLLILCYFYF